MRQKLDWLDKNILFVLSCFLIAFIPLYPKIPLFSPIEEYIVRVRLEDIFILITVIVYFIQFARKKIFVQTPLNWFIGIYSIVGILSLLSAFFLVITIPLQAKHIGKSVLHFFRYLEYFSIFFITISSVRNKKQLHIIMGVIAAVIVTAAVYGFGQKYYGFPVFSTMNREYSKGVVLELTNDKTRVQSTFAGHYDLAAYLVIILPLVLSFFYASEKTALKILFGFVILSGIWLLVVSALRSAFLAFLIAIGLVTLLSSMQKNKWRKRIIWFCTRSIGVYVITLIIFVGFGKNMKQLFIHSLEAYPKTYNMYRSIFPASQDSITDDNALIDQYIPPQPKTSTVPPDVDPGLKEKVEVVTIGQTGEIIVSYEDRPPVYSECAQKRGLSLCIRLDALWPQAIKGFLKNPFVGSGYATLNKQNLHHFTEIDGTDNNYLRTLGETGILGFISFYGAIITAFLFGIKASTSKNVDLATIAIGYTAGTIGLLIVAFLIDVFAASKVAFTFWALTGIFFGYYTAQKKKNCV